MVFVTTCCPDLTPGCLHIDDTAFKYWASRSDALGGTNYSLSYIEANPLYLCTYILIVASRACRGEAAATATAPLVSSAVDKDAPSCSGASGPLGSNSGSGGAGSGAGLALGEQLASTSKAEAEPRAPEGEGSEPRARAESTLRRFSQKRKATESEQRPLDVKRACNLLLPPDNAFTDAVISGYRLSRRIYESMRRRFVENFLDARKGVPDAEPEAPVPLSERLRREARKQFTKINDDQRRLLLVGLRDDATRDKAGAFAQELSTAVAAFDAKREAKMAAEVARKCARGKVFLLTYNAERFVLPELQEVDVVRKPWPVVSQLAVQSATTKALWSEFEAFVCEAAQSNKIDWAVSQELCMDTYERLGTVRTHFHLAVSRSSRMYLNETFTFMGVKPFLKDGTGENSEVLLKRKGRAALAHQTLYYCSMPKVGQLRFAASKQPHKDYPVNPAWIQTHLEAS